MSTRDPQWSSRHLIHDGDNLKPPRWPSAGEGHITVVHPDVGECSALHRNKPSSHEQTWGSLEDQ